MDGAIGIWVADIKPVTIIQNNGAEFLILDELDKRRDNGNDFFIWDKVEDFRIDTIDSCKLVSAGGVAEDIPHVDHMLAGDVDIAVFSGGSQCKSGDVIGCLVLGDELLNIDIGEDVTVVNDDWVRADE